MFEGLSRALHGIISRVRRVHSIKESDLTVVADQVKEALLAADVPQSVAEELVQSLRGLVLHRELTHGLKPAEQIVHALQQQLTTFLGGVATSWTIERDTALLVVGLQGSGKTTTLAKLAYRIRRQHPTWRLLCCSLDFGRPAAREQLTQLAMKVGAAVYVAKADDPVAAAGELRAYARTNQYDYLLVDTAGRLQTDAHLMNELQQVFTVIKPTHALLVLDGMMGQASLQVAREFAEAVPITGGIISKIDSGARAGIALAFRTALKQPLLFLGIGEQLEDLEQFVPERIVRRLFGEGDLASLAERATERIAEHERVQGEQLFRSGRLTLDDFASQLSMIRSMGSIFSVSKYLPHEISQGLSDERLRQGEHELQRFDAIIKSMTPKERLVPAILNQSRKRRIARGAGVQSAEIGRLLTAFEELQRYATMVKKLGNVQTKPRIK